MVPHESAYSLDVHRFLHVAPDSGDRPEHDWVESLLVQLSPDPSASWHERKALAAAHCPTEASLGSWLAGQRHIPPCPPLALPPALGESQPLGQKPSSDRGSCHLAKPASEGPPAHADPLGELIEAVLGLQILDEPVQDLGQRIRADGRHSRLDILSLTSNFGTPASRRSSPKTAQGTAR